MKIDSTSTALGRIRVLGQRDEGDKQHRNQALWALSGRAKRIPANGQDHGTPGVFGLRTLVLRTLSRPMLHKKIDIDETEIAFKDPLLLDLFIWPDDGDGSAFDLDIFGATKSVKLMEETRVLVAPLWEHPDRRTAGGLNLANNLVVPPYLLHEGSLRVPATSLETMLKDLDPASEFVELRPDGVVYMAMVSPPDGSESIKTRVKLELNKGKVRVVLMNPQPTESQAAWREVWRRINSITATARYTAWARLSFLVDADLPVLRWPAETKNNKIELDWGIFEVPQGFADITLADQPLESMLLPPMQVLRLTRDVRVTRSSSSFVVETLDRVVAPLASYSWDVNEEAMTFADLPLVHDTKGVRRQLDKVYVSQTPNNQRLTGFMMLEDGWAEIGFDQEFPIGKELPEPVLPANAKEARGSFLIGNRRLEFHSAGNAAKHAPWSVLLDEPDKFSVKFNFMLKGGPTGGDARPLPRLESAEILLSGCAVTMRGMAWLASTAPDEHDALPAASDDPSVYFDILLRRCDSSTGKAPFLLSGFKVLAQKLHEDGTDQASNREQLQPDIAPNLTLTVNAPVIAPSQGIQRVWLRHQSLPSVQLMSTTRSDTTSNKPHASRALTPFDRDTAALELQTPAGMMPGLSEAMRESFHSVTVPAGAIDGVQAGAMVPLVALTLPGLELHPQSPSVYQVSGAYTLPLWEDMHARATLPPPEEAVAPPSAPVVTALDPIRMQKLMLDNLRLRVNAGTRDSSMFSAGDIGSAINVTAESLFPSMKWTATVTVRDNFLIKNRTVHFGSVQFNQAPWIWNPNGDELLAGPSVKISFSGTQCVIGNNGAPLVGWSVEEHSENGYILDGGGVSWMEKLKIGTFLVSRPVRGEDKKNIAFQLRSTRKPVTVHGVQGLEWQLTFTDVPVLDNTREMFEPAGLAYTAGRGWTWNLCDLAHFADLAIRPLRLGPCFRFMPTALNSITLTDDSESLKTVVVHGSLVLGMDSPALASDSLRRVAITMTATDTGALEISGVHSLGDDERITWNLDMEPQEDIWSGSAQLSGKLLLDSGVLKIMDANLKVRLFQCDFDVVFTEPLDPTSETGSYQAHTSAGGNLIVQVSEVSIDLVEARLSSVALVSTLREGVSLTIRHMRKADQQSTTTVLMNWFGNFIRWNATMDTARRTCVLELPIACLPLTIFPGQPLADIVDGIFCLGFAPGTKGLEVQSHFMELALRHDRDLFVTHMLRSGDPKIEQDTLRFDGIWKQSSLVSWPQLEKVNFQPALADSSQVVEFKTDGLIQHDATFVLTDHRMDGSGLVPAKNAPYAGIRPWAAKTSTALNWLVEATHLFTPKSGKPVEFRCISPLQFWNAEQLAIALKAASKDNNNDVFGFVPGYLARTPTSLFPRPGVRRTDYGHAGMFSSGILQALKAPVLQDAWLMVGGMTALCPEGGIDARDSRPKYVLLHLPFVTAVCANGAADGLTEQLATTRLDKEPTTMRMSRHDVLAARICTEAPQAVAVADLVIRPARREIQFTRDLLPTATLAGAALAQSWFGDLAQIVPGWHVEQVQRPGPTSEDNQKTVLPFPFPRAAVMLAALFEARAEPNDSPYGDTLSVLTRIMPRGRSNSIQEMDVNVRTVGLQPVLRKPADATDANRGDLIVGGAGGVVAVSLSKSDMTVEDDKYFIALAIGHMAEPVFVIRRWAATNDAYRNCRLPDKDRDPLDFAIRPMRSALDFPPDGRITWPSAVDSEKKDTELTIGPRAPIQYPAPLAMAAITGRMETALLMGTPFTLDIEATKELTNTVWVQEWENVAFDLRPDYRDEAAPWMRDASVPVRPLVPSTREISRALLRMDPALAGTEPRQFQTYLPAVTDSIDFSSRAGAAIALGVRGLRSVHMEHRKFETADGGTAQTRLLRRPRPVPLPPNDGNPNDWRRTVAWYGDPQRTCVALAGAWDLVTGPVQGDQHLPSWCAYIGRPQPYDLVKETRGAPPVWQGSVVVQCIVYDEKNQLLPMPALVLLAMLEQALVSGNLRCGLHVGQGWIEFEKIELLKETEATSTGTRLAFFREEKAQRITEGVCTFECSFVPPPVIATTDKEFLKLEKRERDTLDDVAMRTLTLPVHGPVKDIYPLPLQRRTVFFADPAFDRQLSRVEAISINQVFDPALPDEVFNAWIDRPSLTPDESAVLRVKSTNAKVITFKLTATVKRHAADEIEDLLFHLGSADIVQTELTLGINTFYTLPTSILRSKAGGAFRSGDTLTLKIAVRKPGIDDWKDAPFARLVVAVKSRSALPAPQAMYSLLTANEVKKQAWCSAHSALPAPEKMWTEVLDASTDKLLRRGSFKWVSIDPSAPQLAYCILKAETTTESMHIPMTLDYEIDVSRNPAKR